MQRIFLVLEDAKGRDQRLETTTEMLPLTRRIRSGSRMFPVGFLQYYSPFNVASV